MANKKPLFQYQIGDEIYVDNAFGYSGKAIVVKINKRGLPSTIERDDRSGWDRNGRISRKYKSQLGDTYWSIDGLPASRFSMSPFPGSSAPSTPKILTKSKLQATINTLTAAVSPQTMSSMPSSSNYYFSSGNNSGHMFVDPKTGNSQLLSAGLPVVLIKGKGLADNQNEANPIWKDTGIVGTVMGVNHMNSGSIEVQVEWGNGFVNIYDLSECELQFANFVPPFKKKEAFKLKSEELNKLVLEESVKKEILAVLKQHENRDKLFDEWGLGETIEYGRGMSMMFWGGPGTGKTWGAHCIAKALGQELMVISAAEVQSSEPGATERNIQEAFKEATESNKVLFIDECDSLITTRADLGMVLAAQVNCLLTSLEKHEGVVILATNRIETMDEALERRLALIVEFPFPKYAQRIDIWKKLLPSKLPLAAGLTPEVLAQPKFTGGLIKNIILQSARLAVAEGAEAVTKVHVDQAVERLNKSRGIMGRRDRSVTGRPIQDMSVGVVVGSNMQVDRVSDMDVNENISLDDFLDGNEDEEDNKKN